MAAWPLEMPWDGWVDRHPRPVLVAGVLASYATCAVLLFCFAKLWLFRDNAPGRRTALDVGYALFVSIGATSGAVFARRRERRDLRLRSLDDWWTVHRCIRRGRAPADARLWWATDDLVERRSRTARRNRIIGPVIMLAFAVFAIAVDAPYQVFADVIAGLALLGAAHSVVARHLELRRLGEARQALASCHPTPESPATLSRG